MLCRQMFKWLCAIFIVLLALLFAVAEVIYEELDERITKLENNSRPLPCKVGDMVYVPNSATRSVDEYKVFRIHNYGGLWEFSATRADDKITYSFDESIIGDNVFLSRAEAELVLKARVQE